MHAQKSIVQRVVAIWVMFLMMVLEIQLVKDTALMVLP
jgi:hypothetical protein